MSIEMMGTELRMNNQSKKTFLKISSEKFWWFRKSPYLCIRFPKRKPLKKSSLKDLDINKQVVQELT